MTSGPIAGDKRSKAPCGVVLWTKTIMAASIALLIGWDVVVANNPWRADTVSEITLWANLRSYTLVAALGYVSGHLTWPAKNKRPLWVVLSFSFVFAASLLLLDLLTWTGVVNWKALSFVRAWPPLVFLPSYVLGRLFWPQVRT